MTDEELIRAVAEKVMGMDTFVFGGDDYWKPKGRPVEAQDPFLPVSGQAAFNPLTNPAHWMMVVERMREDFYIIIDVTPEAFLVTFAKDKDGIIVTVAGARHKDLGHAVCKAALKAVRG